MVDEKKTKHQLHAAHYTPLMRNHPRLAHHPSIVQARYIQDRERRCRSAAVLLTVAEKHQLELTLDQAAALVGFDLRQYGSRRKLVQKKAAYCSNWREGQEREKQYVRWATGLIAERLHREERTPATGKNE